MKKLILKNINASFKNSYQKNNANKKNVLNDINISLRNDELLVLLGPSGCGKSTLLLLISGLKEPDSGSIQFGDKIYFDKENAINLPTEERNIGFCFQSYALWPHLTVEKNIEFPLKARKNSKEAIKNKTKKILEIVHMEGSEKKYPFQLSGGEKQRIALARSLVYEPSLLLLDEPLANLDAKLKTSLLPQIKEIQKELNIPMIYVTHDQNEAFEIADRIIVMNDGKIIQNGLPREIYQKGKNSFVVDFVGKSNIYSKKMPIFFKGKKPPHAICIRPEDVRLEENGEFEGVIRNVKYKGNHRDFIIEVGSDRILSSVYGKENYHVGDKVRFNINYIHSY